jgi:hypothetical protein
MRHRKKSGDAPQKRRQLHKPINSANSYPVTNDRSTVDPWLLSYLFYLEAKHYLSKGGRISDFYLTRGWDQFRALRDTGETTHRHSCWQDVYAASSWLGQFEVGKINERN